MLPDTPSPKYYYAITANDKTAKDIKDPEILKRIEEEKDSTPMVFFMAKIKDQAPAPQPDEKGKDGSTGSGADGKSGDKPDGKSGDKPGSDSTDKSLYRPNKAQIVIHKNKESPIKGV